MDYLDIDKRVDNFFTELDKRIAWIERIINNTRITNTTSISTTPPPKAEPVPPDQQ